VPVIDHWWQTETGWAIAANPVGLGAMPVKYGSPSVPMPGYDLAVLDDGGAPVAAGTLGNIVVKLPLPPGCLPTLWNCRRPLPSKLSRRLSRPLPHRRRRLSRRGRLRFRHGPHRTTSSTSRGTGSPPARWRKCCQAIPTSPNAPLLAWPTR
jgi:hypothetical protein